MPKTFLRASMGENLRFCKKRKKKKEKRISGMDLYGLVWICMDCYGFVWITKGLYGFVNFCMDISLFHF